MEKKIRAYEKFIARETKREMEGEEHDRLWRYHCEMMADFQHERLIHLIVTLFFALMMMAALFVTAWTISVLGTVIEMLPLYVMTLILVVLTGFYVRHYYFLENHIQELYKYTKELL